MRHYKQGNRMKGSLENKTYIYRNFPNTLPFNFGKSIKDKKCCRNKF